MTGTRSGQNTCDAQTVSSRSEVRIPWNAFASNTPRVQYLHKPLKAIQIETFPMVYYAKHNHRRGQGVFTGDEVASALDD
jgi:hypothetical protein